MQIPQISRRHLCLLRIKLVNVTSAASTLVNFLLTYFSRHPFSPAFIWVLLTLYLGSTVSVEGSKFGGCFYSASLLHQHGFWYSVHLPSLSPHWNSPRTSNLKHLLHPNQPLGTIISQTPPLTWLNLLRLLHLRKTGRSRRVRFEMRSSLRWMGI